MWKAIKDWPTLTELFFGKGKGPSSPKEEPKKAKKAPAKPKGKKAPAKPKKITKSKKTAAKKPAKKKETKA